MPQTHKRSNSVHLKRSQSSTSTYSAHTPASSQDFDKFDLNHIISYKTPYSSPWQNSPLAHWNGYSPYSGGPCSEKIDLDQITIESEKLHRRFSRQLSRQPSADNAWWTDVLADSKDSKEYKYAERNVSVESVTEQVDKMLPESSHALLESFSSKKFDERPSKINRVFSKLRRRRTE